MKHTQKGAASWLALAFIAVIIIAIVGIGLIWKKGGVVANNPSQVATVSTGIPDTGAGYTYSIATSTANSSAVVTNTNTTEPQTRTVTTYETRTVPATQTRTVTTRTHYASTGVSSATYHNATFGLTLRLPSAGWTAYQTAGGPAGLPGTAQIHFIAPGESQDAFVINVWDKAGWNYVRTTENYVHLNTNNIGEGTYLGENFTWIYSYTMYSHPEAQGGILGAVFY